MSGKAPKVFGTPLHELLAWERQIEPSLTMPTIVTECLEYLQRQEVYNTEGIFRLSGSLQKINDIRALYDAVRCCRFDFFLLTLSLSSLSFSLIFRRASRLSLARLPIQTSSRAS